MSAPREEIIATARSLFRRGLTHGSTGNISVRTERGAVITPTGSSLGTVRAEELSTIDPQGRHIDGPMPSKEAFLHAAVLRARPDATAVVHTHSTHAAALSCIAPGSASNVLPPVTAYSVMRIGTLPLLPYAAPGDAALGPVAEAAARDHHALLLSNHGPIVAGVTLAAAVDAIEELEEAAKLFFLLRGHEARLLAPEQVRALRPSSSAAGERTESSLPQHT